LWLYNEYEAHPQNNEKVLVGKTTVGAYNYGYFSQTPFSDEFRAQPLFLTSTMRHPKSSFPKYFIE